VFFTSFTLSSGSVKLSGAELSAKISHGKSVIAILPVSTGAEGEYQVSWTLPSATALPGDYNVDVFRKVDLVRASSSDPYGTAKPFFTVTINHEGVASSPLPFRTEVVFLIGALVVVVVTTFQKLALESKEKS